MVDCDSLHPLTHSLNYVNKMHKSHAKFSFAWVFVSQSENLR